MSDIQTFKQAVETFLRETEWTPTRLGRAAANDPLFVFQLRSGREPRSATRQRVIDFIAGYSKNTERAA